MSHVEALLRTQRKASRRADGGETAAGTSAIEHSSAIDKQVKVAVERPMRRRDCCRRIPTGAADDDARRLPAPRSPPAVSPAASAARAGRPAVHRWQGMCPPARRPPAARRGCCPGRRGTGRCGCRPSKHPLPVNVADPPRHRRSPPARGPGRRRRRQGGRASSERRTPAEQRQAVRAVADVAVARGRDRADIAARRMGRRARPSGTSTRPRCPLARIEVACDERDGH